MKKIKIIQLVEDLKIGGLEKIIATISEKLDKRRYQVEVWCVAQGGAIADELIRKGIEVKIINIYDYHNPFNVLRLMRLFKIAKPDIIHAHGYFAGVAGRVSAKLSKVPIVIYHVHSTYWEYKKRHRWIEKILSYFTDKIICCSKAVAEFVVKTEKIKPSKVIVIYNGITVSKPSNSDILKLRNQLRISPDNFIVGTVASLVPHKGHVFFLRAAKKILSFFPNTQFLIVGDGPLRAELEKQTQYLGIASRVIFTGTRKDVPVLVSIMDIFVLPSCSREGLGIALLEAMALGKVVVGTSVGGIPEVIKDKVTGLIVPPFDAERLAEAIIWLLQNRHRAEEMSAAANRFYHQKFTSQIMLKHLQILYDDLLKIKKK